MTSIGAIDPGSTESAWVVIDADYRPITFGKDPNLDVRDMLAGFGSPAWSEPDILAIERIASYGMPVGREVFDTCVWIGRFVEAGTRDEEPDLVYRSAVKMHHCHSMRATDATIRQALVDRFSPGERNHGKGTKKNPGWFHGFHSDIWQAMALAVYAADKIEAGEPL